MTLKIQYKPIADLIPYARNSRTHDEAQVAQIAASIREFGWTNPVLLDGNNGIIAGHGRVLAAQKLGEIEVPTIELGHMSESQKRAYIIADNKLALNAGWDNEMLLTEFTDLKAVGYDMELTGFSLDEINGLGLEEELPEKEPKGNLSDRFLIPPFSVLNAREGWWQDRKRAWLALGIKSEEGRGGGEYEGNATALGFDNEEQRRDAQLRRSALASPGGSMMVAGYKNGKRLVGLKNIGKSNG